MEIRRKRADTRPGPREWFTGPVWMDEIAMPGPGTFMTHLAVQEADGEGQTTYWGEHVTDDEYRG